MRDGAPLLHSNSDYTSNGIVWKKDPVTPKGNKVLKFSNPRHAYKSII